MGFKATGGDIFLSLADGPEGLKFLNYFGQRCFLRQLPQRFQDKLFVAHRLKMTLYGPGSKSV